MPWFKVTKTNKIYESTDFAVRAASIEEAEQKCRDHFCVAENPQDVRQTDCDEDIEETNYDCEGECVPPDELVFPDDLRPNDIVIIPNVGAFTIRGISIGGDLATLYFQEDHPAIEHSRSLSLQRLCAD